MTSDKIIEQLLESIPRSEEQAGRRATSSIARRRSRPMADESARLLDAET